MSIDHLIFDEDGDLLLVLGQRAEAPGVGGLNPDLAMSVYEQAIQQADVTMDDSEVTDDRSSSVSLVEGEEPPELDPEVLVPEMHMLVSSKHLMTASPVFKAMFKRGHFKEGIQLQAGKSEVALEDDPPAAFKILMDILHFNIRKGPRTIDFDTLSDLAVLVDKYQFLESVENFADRWLDGLIGTAFDGDKGLIQQFHKCLSIFWVFRSLRPEGIRQFANYVAIESKTEVNTSTEYDLPIPGFLLDHIKNCRENLISGALEHVDYLLNTYLHKKKGRGIVCRGRFGWGEEMTKKRKTCDHMMCGSLMTSLLNCGLWPLPASPFDGISVQSMLKLVASVQLSAGCDIWQHGDQWHNQSLTGDEGHGRMKQLNRKLAPVTKKVEELNVLDFEDLDMFS